MTSRLKIILSSFAILISAGFTWLVVDPPDYLRIGANYTAKIVCSNVFIAGRDPNEVLADDVRAPGHFMLKFMQVRVDRQQGIVHANLAGFLGDGLAVFRKGTGCAVVPDGVISKAKQFQTDMPPAPLPSPTIDWPVGSRAVVDQKVDDIIHQDKFAGPGMRGIAVIHKGKLIAQRYGNGFTEHAPLIGWSMTKTVNAALIGRQINEGRLALDESGFWHIINPAAKASDPREEIKLSDLMAMSSGLRFDEDYDHVSDVTRMLYLAPDMVSYVADLPLEHPIGSVWNYNSGTSVLLSRLWQYMAGDDALNFPQQHLFTPLGMSSAVFETDARGNFVGASYIYATAQDWARFGQFLLQEGVWNDVELLPDDFVKMMVTVAPASKGKYGQGQIWLEGPDGDTPEGENPDKRFNLPQDTYWMQGHDGQSLAIVPSKQLVVVRLGLTPSRMLYMPQAMLAEIIKVLD